MQRLFRADEFAIHFYVIAFPRLRAEVGADLAVDRDVPGGDQFVAMAARADSGSGEKAV